MAPRRAWAWAGAVAGASGLGALLASTAFSLLWLVRALLAVAAVGLAVFGTGLRRELDEQEPVGSLVPNLALGGLLVTAGTCLVGGGLGTRLADVVDVPVTLGWAWAGVGLTAAGVGWAGLAHESVGRGLAVASAVTALLVAVGQLVPAPQLAAIPAGLWCVGAGVALSRGC